jgi:GNAT superfamily N-acetyltransferase
VVEAASARARRPPGQSLRKRLAEPGPDATLAAFVVDRPDRAGLAACAVGTIERRLGDAANPSGEYGYVFNVATDPEYRWRGFSRACMRGVLDWYAARGVRKIDLKATGPAEPLYRSLGFSPSMVHTPMRLRLAG